MKLQSTLRNLASQPENDRELSELRMGKWQFYHPEETESMTVHGKSYVLRSGLTFTPYASPTRCNAHCRFCSEELQRKDQKDRNSSYVIADYDQYFEAFVRVLDDLSSLRNIGLSLSGLEATSDPLWLEKLLNCLKGENTPLFDEKVLYTNGSGLCTHPLLIDQLVDHEFDRLEVSRCHDDESVNQQVMYFNRNQPVFKNENYELLISRLSGRVKVKSSCIMTQTGVSSIDEIERYLDWQISLGVKEVVFRELSILGDLYQDNGTKQWVDQNRVSIHSILSEVMPALGHDRSDWEYKQSRTGYYYYNEQFIYKGQVEVILETSSYRELVKRNQNEALQKLVFHPNGNLCGDWDPDHHVLTNYFETCVNTTRL